MNSIVAIFGMTGGWEYLVILGLALLFFGNRIPSMARSLGQGIVEFRKGLKGDGEKKKLPGEGEEPKAGH
jgi:sec-independent protein translocase protein TatA